MDGQDFRNVPVYRGGVKVLMQKKENTQKKTFSLRLNFLLFPCRRVSLIGQALFVMLESLHQVCQIFSHISPLETFINIA